MLVTELGFATALILGVSLGFVGFAILIFWIKLFFKDFDAESKFFLPLFWIHEIIWIVGTCIIPANFLDSTFDVWAWPFLIYFLGSIVIMAILKIVRK